MAIPKFITEKKLQETITKTALAYAHSLTAHAPSTAEANVNADWNSTSGDSQILNKSTALAMMIVLG